MQPKQNHRQKATIRGFLKMHHASHCLQHKNHTPVPNAAHLFLASKAAEAALIFFSTDLLKKSLWKVAFRMEKKVGEKKAASRENEY